MVGVGTIDAADLNLLLLTDSVDEAKPNVMCLRLLTLFRKTGAGMSPPDA
jgi:hypothetical protein